MYQAIELAKTLRPIVDNPKAKGMEKDKKANKAKQKDNKKEKEQPPLYDYHDGSVHDSSLRKHIERGYEQFKVLSRGLYILKTTRIDSRGTCR